MVHFQVAPEQPAQIVGQAAQRGEIQGRLPLGQVGDQQVTHRAALDAALADQFLDGRLPPPADHPDRRRGRGLQHPGRVQQLVEVRAPGLPSAAALSARAYWLLVDSVCSRSWAIEDWRG